MQYLRNMRILILTMKIKFRPMPWLTFVVLICLGILLTLGTWQYKRLIWKTGILTQIDEAAHAAPLTSLTEINALLASEQPVDFRKVSLSVDFVKPVLNTGEVFHLLRSNGKAFTWHLYQPVVDGGVSAYVATREFTEIQKDKPPASMTGLQDIVGYVRLVQSANWATPDSAPETNRWFAFNANPDVLDWGQGGQIETAYYIDHVEQVANVADLPVRMPEIANNHLDYMLTWYSFAFILLVIYFLLHKRAGRLRIERG